ncbi:MAG: ATP synthase F1 subunit delta [Alphaproteobacteria bacterium RIFCSPLOWO2_01_FULL_40_26]|nr:MAG: ATP synthase F1 subunit delta [Alphaproteobacteria bacterium RIFCSPHIGHO2_02_FULL_40_34]OFW85582.1 MAG: ATP synthase F1 subunit delta [Alphaproteobacteria bacterium RIFCSPHIGHO2_01_FULL_40_8]OFW95000.1 MAG: ATP synthase F1 subunit delta [Alphaproteobacteria bacterium RIFCSPLOWO2_01_FULL_40_26]OFX10552.1 MAG: ATP synthase F1 subunit delta [Alphaproteobacteria bacterium RIFCSPLOWO2_02_FULL_40_19]OFX12083.1 MAG: ATP synthase F1 subunit delta [Alphaproteobacteria bacterium RIFCSPLOWO2_12_FU
MPRISVVAKNYAKALFVAARKNNSLDKVASELEVFKQNFSTSFAHELKNPVIARTDLVHIISEVTKKFELGALTSNFFASIVRNRRLNLFPEIYEEFSRLVKAYKNILEVEVIAAVKPKKSQLDRVKILIEKKYPGKTVAIKETIKEKILGGIQIKIGSEVIDASLKSQFEKLQKECLAAIN